MDPSASKSGNQQDSTAWSAFLCEICEQPYGDCFCYKVCDKCEQPTNECNCDDSSPFTNNHHQEKPNPSGGRPSPSVQNGICIYFLQGRCTYGDACKYTHSVSYPPINSVPVPINDFGMQSSHSQGGDICKFFAAGSCKYGKSCRFTHSVPVSIPIPAPKTQSNRGEKPNNSSGNSTLSDKMAQLLDLQEEIGLLEGVLSEKREMEALLEREIEDIHSNS